MALEVVGGFVVPDRLPHEVVERKGLGHPDTLADGIAEATELAYAGYCLDRYGVIPHHNLDKATLIGGMCLQQYGGGRFTHPVEMVFLGRASKSFGGEEIPVAEIQDQATRTYLGRTLPHLDTADPNVYTWRSDTSTRSTRPYWFSPRSIEDLPEYQGPYPRANDTATMISYWPLTATEALALDLEGYFWQEGPDGLQYPRFDHIGQDIKVMCVRNGDTITATLCVPQVTTETPDAATYFEREAELRHTLQAYAEEMIGESANVQVVVNTQTMGPNPRPYMVTGGSATDFGEEGAVGRGNKTNGIISSFRPNTMEAPHGKNPTYFVGKLLGYQADLIARSVYETLGVRCQVILQANLGDNLFDPSRVIVNTETSVSDTDVQAVVDRCLSLGRRTTDEIIRTKHFTPRTNAYHEDVQRHGHA